MTGNSRALRWIERLLVAAGVVCLGYYGYMSAEARQVQREQAAVFESLLPRAESASARDLTQANSSETLPDRPAGRSGGPAAPSAPSVPSAPSAPGAPGSNVLGLLDIPRLDISTPVLSGDDDDTLDVAVGHLPDTPKPWESGNSAFAAHRDGLFRPLRNIRVGDELRVRTLQGDFTYRVRETKIVLPTDLSVLEPRDGPTLTLITCYPFNFVGNAPKRFIVHADRLPADPQ